MVLGDREDDLCVREVAEEKKGELEANDESASWRSWPVSLGREEREAGGSGLGGSWLDLRQRWWLRIDRCHLREDANDSSSSARSGDHDARSVDLSGAQARLDPAGMMLDPCQRALSCCRGALSCCRRARARAPLIPLPSATQSSTREISSPPRLGRAMPR